MKRSSYFLLLTFVLALVATPVSAQDPDYIFYVPDADAPNGSNLDLTVGFDNLGAPIGGFSFGVCHDPAALQLNSATDVGTTTENSNNGAPPGFLAINVYPEAIPGQSDAAGWNMGVVIDLFGGAFIEPGTGYTLGTGSYTVVGDAGTSTSVGTCDTVGLPPVDVVVVVAGASIIPTQNPGTVTIPAGPPPFLYSPGSTSVPYDADSGNASATVNMSVLEDPSSPSYVSVTQGFSMGVSHDTALLTVAGNPEWIVSSFSPDFFGPALVTGGWTVGIVYSFTGVNTLEFDAATEVIGVTYDADPALLAGLDTETSTEISFSNELGAPPVVNVVVVGGNSIDVGFESGTITFVPVTDTPFLRGNCNNDGTTNIADGIWILNFLYQSGPAATCTAACDFNDDGMMDMSDAIGVISWRLMDGPPPSAPFPDCGTVAGADCEATSYCP